MDFYRSKLFGFHRFQTKFKFYDPKNIQYLTSEKYGYFEAPKFTKNRSLSHLVFQYKQKLEYEKYFNPKGYKYTYTANFPKVSTDIYLTNPNIYLVRTDKKYPSNFAKFNVPMNYSKFEIKQFIQKMYQSEIKTIHVSILPGEVKFDNDKRRYVRTRDVKRAAIEFYSKVDQIYRKINPDRSIKLEDIENEDEEM